MSFVAVFFVFRRPMVGRPLHKRRVMEDMVRLLILVILVLQLAVMLRII